MLLALIQFAGYVVLHINVVLCCKSFGKSQLNHTSTTDFIGLSVTALAPFPFLYPQKIALSPHYDEAARAVSSVRASAAQKEISLFAHAMFDASSAPLQLAVVQSLAGEFARQESPNLGSML